MCIQTGSLSGDSGLTETSVLCGSEALQTVSGCSVSKRKSILRPKGCERALRSKSGAPTVLRLEGPRKAPSAPNLVWTAEQPCLSRGRARAKIWEGWRDPCLEQEGVGGFNKQEA